MSEIVEYTFEELKKEMELLSPLYDVVRLVNPFKCEIIDIMILVLHHLIHRFPVMTLGNVYFNVLTALLQEHFLPVIYNPNLM